MPVPYSRRRLLRIGGGSAVAVAVPVALAGCTGGSNAACELRHEVSAWEDASAHSGATIPYAALSAEGQAAFEAALESGSHALTYDGTNKPPDFSYAEEVTTYVVAYEGERYALNTSTGEGCVIA